MACSMIKPAWAFYEEYQAKSFPYFCTKYFLSNEYLNIQYIRYYSKCPKISNTKVSDRIAYANSVDPDQTAPEGAV